MDNGPMPRPVLRLGQRDKMRALYRLLISSTLLAVLFAFAAFRKQSPHQQSPTHVPSANLERGSSTQPNPIRWVQCDVKAADTILRVNVIIRTVAHQEFILPLKKERLYEDDGSPMMSSGSEGMIVCADGFKNGHGIGYVGSANFADATDHDVTIWVNFSWTAPDNTRGKLERKVTIPIGQSFEQQLSDLASIKADFKPAR